MLVPDCLDYRSQISGTVPDKIGTPASAGGMLQLVEFCKQGKQNEERGMQMSSNLTRWGGPAGMLGGLLWAITPLRDVVFGGGATPDHPVFRPYNVVLILIAALLIVSLASLHAQYKGTYRRLGKAGIVVIFVGYALILIGSIPAVLLTSNGLQGLVSAGQDLGFLGSLVTAVGAILLGIALWRTQAASRAAALLLIITLPIGLPGIFVMSSIGPISIAGLAMTAPYGVAWMILGNHLWSNAGEFTAEGAPGARRVR